ncbi:pyridoxamine 5'-phosphate oxidase family protein [Verrucomicrobia bacterium]|nr:pyridoxamine 5'-phosphate oxidase family protein [Verrucomicrobiota bacterium]
MLPDQVFALLSEATSQPKSSLRTPVLANSHGEEAQVRTIVLRSVNIEEKQLIAYTDWRSPKVAQLLKGPQASWLFYDPVEKYQFRIETRVEILHRNEYTKTLWNEGVPLNNRVSYCSPSGPGNLISTDDHFLTEEQRVNPSVENTEEGLANFAVIRATATVMEVLQLRSDGEHDRFSSDLERGTCVRLIP